VPTGDRFLTKGFQMSDSNGPSEPSFPLDIESMHRAMHEARAIAEEVLQEVLARNPYATLEELNAALQERASTINLRPQRDLGGLSPEQMQRLLSADWETRGGAIRLHAALTLEELAPSHTLHNTRVFLRYLEEHGAIKATAADNLPRAAVAALVERMRWPAGYVDELHAINKVLNEQDVFSLHVLRVTLELAGLIKRRKASFSLTRRGAQLLADERAGELFALLFRTTFRRFNLAYLDAIAPVPEFQSTLPFSLFRLAQVAEQWKRPEELSGEVVLPFVRARLPATPSFDEAALMLELRLLEPLEGFGVLEKRAVPTRGRIRPIFAYRKTRLYDRFLRFHLPPTLPRPRGSRGDS
jgi:hypothetical protein